MPDLDKLAAAMLYEISRAATVNLTSEPYIRIVREYIATACTPLEQQLTDTLARALRAEQGLFACQWQLAKAKKQHCDSEHELQKKVDRVQKQLESERAQWAAARRTQEFRQMLRKAIARAESRQEGERT